jgi:hypothetical protein
VGARRGEQASASCNAVAITKLDLKADGRLRGHRHFRHEQSMKPILVVNPANDRVFAAFAETLIDHGVLSITEFERRLQTVYPRAAAHARDLAAEPILIWYVYREGHWVNARSLANELGVPEDDA